MNKIIELKKVSKTFKLPHERNMTIKSGFINAFASKRNMKTESQHVLQNISFTINDGEFVGIVGRNGSGKSTLLKIIAGIYKPNTGSIEVNGKIVPFIELGVGFNPELSGRENVYLNGALLGFSRKQIDERFKSIIDFSELEKFIDQKLKNYSSGMQVRLAFSIATRLSESDILLIDEVLAVGDEDFQRKCFDYFRKLKKEKKTVVLVTHDMNAVREYCDRAILIEKSKIVTDGKPEEVASLYSKLFYKTAEDTQLAEINRWGNKNVEIEKITLSKKNLTSKDKVISVNCKIKSNIDVGNLIAGISVMNAAGVRIFGTNTKLLQRPNLSLAKNQSQVIEWELPHVFNDGHYTVSPALVSSDGQIYDSWDGAAEFRVYEEFGTSFPVNPPIQFSIKE